MKLISVRDEEIAAAKAEGKEAKTLSPEWLKRDPVSRVFRVVIYRAGHGRLDKTTKERVSKQRAVALGEQMIAKWLGAPLRAGSGPRRPKFEEVARIVMELRSVRRERTYEAARLHIGKNLIPVFGHLHVDQITEAAWEDFIAQFQRERPGLTLYDYAKHMGYVMGYAFKKGLIPRELTFRNPDPPRKKGRVFTPFEIEEVLAHAATGIRDQVIFASTMGMRLREILKLEWERVDLKAGTVTLRPENTKTKKGRVMVVSPQARAVLERRQAMYAAGSARSPFVFPHRFNPLLPVTSNKTGWREAKARAGVTGVAKFHHLRHTFLTECAKLVRAGKVSVVQICSYAGLSIQVFERVYLHIDHKDTAPVAQLIAVKLREPEQK